MDSRDDDDVNPSPEPYLARVPSGDWDEATWQALLEWSPSPSHRADATEKVTTFYVSLAQAIEQNGPPRSAEDINRVAGSTIATEALGRMRWQYDNVSLECASRALKAGPDAVLLDSLAVARSDNPHTIFATLALYDDARDTRAVQLATDRSFGSDADPRTDDAVANVVNRTARLIASSGCVAPLICTDLSLSDFAVPRVIDDDIPFALEIGADWCGHDVAALDSLRALFGNSPFELFLVRGEHIHTFPRTGAKPVEMIRLRHGDHETDGLMYARVPGNPQQYFLLRPVTRPEARAYERLQAGADLATFAAGLLGAHPLRGLGMDNFYASENENERFDRYATAVQTLVTFSRCTAYFEPRLDPKGLQ
jgi:hypothetical protein